MTTSTLIALAFAVLATTEWRRRPVAARVYLAAATGYALAALGGDAPALLASAPRGGAGYVAAAVGLAGLAALAAEVARLARGAPAARR